MQFKVPQFLEIEDKIFGPFTFRQFAYLAGGGGICFVLFKLMGFVWGILPILAVAGFTGALTFYRPNDKPFINMLEAGFQYLFQSKLYIWKRRTISREDQKQERMEAKSLSMPPHISKLSGSKLRDLAWSLDVLDLKK